MQQTKEYLQHDLGTAAFLVVKGFRFLGLVNKGGGRYAFRFADEDGRAAETSLGYMQGESVPARALIAAEKDLKTALYSGGNGNRNKK